MRAAFDFSGETNWFSVSKLSSASEEVESESAEMFARGRFCVCILHICSESSHAMT